MIESVAELLRRLVEKWVPVLDAEPVRHGPTIGDMYEGLSAKVLAAAMDFDGVELEVVTGFIEGASGVLSPQLDCMVVTGPGREIPFSGAHVYPIERVLAVVEVKKSLYADDIADGYDKCRAVSALKPAEVTALDRERASRLFELTTGRKAPSSPYSMPKPWAVLFYWLQVEAILPARIVLGYHGYRDANAFRAAVAKDVVRRLPNGPREAGPVALPTIVMNDRFAIVKHDAMPYFVASPGSDACPTWRVYNLSTEPPLRVLLEVLWSRLTARFGGSPGLFGEDLDVHRLSPLLHYEWDESAGVWAVVDYRELEVTSAELEAPPRRWSPAKITDDESTVIACLSGGSMIERATAACDMPIDAWEAAIDGLADKKIIGSDPSAPDRFDFVTNSLCTLFTPEGDIYAGDDVSGRLTRWVEQKVGGGVRMSVEELFAWHKRLTAREAKERARQKARTAKAKRRAADASRRKNRC